MHSWTSQLAHSHILPLALTLGSYLVAQAIQRAARGSALLNPTLLAITLVVVALPLLRIDYKMYFAAAQPIHLLLGPAVVALAVPLYRHASLVRERAFDLLTGLGIGSLTAILAGLVLAWSLGVSRAGLLSVAPKSATTAVSMAISAQVGGVPALTAVMTILAGITGAVSASYLLNLLRIRDPVVRGFSMGLASHGIATARAFEESDTAGTFAGLAMGLNAIVTAILVPPILHLLLH